MINNYKQAAELIDQADAVLIGASNGLSISEGYNIFANNAYFRNTFGDLQNKYNLQNILQGCFTEFASEEDKWKFWSRLIEDQSLNYHPTAQMDKLYDLVKDKDYFVITSNGEDHFIPSGFDPEKVFEIEGKITEMRCSAGCNPSIVSSKEAVKSLLKNNGNSSVDSNAFPTCQYCGAPMDINIAKDQSFFRNPQYLNKQANYQDFLDRNYNKQIVILELGVGKNNQMIKAPFMNLTAINPNIHYITINKGDLWIPTEISSRSLAIDDDLSQAISKITEYR